MIVNKIIKSAQNSIILIDNYVDESILDILTQKNDNVNVIILSHKIDNKLILDVEKANSQYPEIKLLKFNLSHDRFVIIDEKEVYHIGASLKDLGKKWFAFTKLENSTISILEKIKQFLT